MLKFVDPVVELIHLLEYKFAPFLLRVQTDCYVYLNANLSAAMSVGYST